MNYKKTLNYLYSLESPEIKLGLEGMRSLLNKIENPEKGLRCIHVAGTNGKGSVCAMMFYILREAGYNVGIYTSPHLKKFNERIRINGYLITDKEIVECFLKVKPYITSQSFFEITTAIAFLYFKEKKVDYVVLEVGLGGRLDATNVVAPLISVITNIGLEHIDLLGNTIEKIAFEKAGIIKQNIPAVTGAKGSALKVIKKIAKQKNAPLHSVKKYHDVDFEHLNGAFQQQNKDIALTAIDVLRKNNKIKLNNEKVISGIKKTKWPGRMDFIEKNVLADGAHNPDGFKVLKKELLIFKKQKKLRNFIFVVSILSTKDAESMLKIIHPLVSAIIFTKSANEIAFGPEELLKIFNKINKNNGIIKKMIGNPQSALKYAKKIAEKNDLVVVTGSLYMIGEVI